MSVKAGTKFISEEAYLAAEEVALERHEYLKGEVWLLGEPKNNFHMSAVTVTKFITEEEYLAAEETSLERHEYYKGEVFAMSGGSINHEAIVSDSLIAIGVHLKKKSRRVFPSNLKIQSEATTLFTYPDLSIFCEKLKTYKNRTDVATNPTVIIEVLSPSTQNYDRGDKFMLYRDLLSLKEYILISSTKILVEHYIRQADDKWQLSVYKRKEDLFTIQSIDFTTEIGVFYEKANFDEAEKMPSLKYVRNWF